MGHADSGDEESFSAGLLEYPHYTRPEVFEGLAVPPVLTSGDHARIAAWRREQALRRTLERRPELLADARLDEGDVTYVRDLVAGRAGNGAGDAAQAGGLADGPESAAENAPGATKNFPRAPFGGRKRLGRNLYLALLHYPVVNKRGKVGAVSLTNLDVHDIARVSRSNGLGGYYLATPIEDQRRLIAELTEHWIGGAGRTANPDRAEALSLVRVCADLDEILDDVARRTGARPALIATSARGAGDMTASRVRELLERVPVLLVMGTASGLAPEVLARAQGVVRPIRWMDAYNHLSVRSAAAILVDRILADVH
jgi:tRNA (guanine37-N1)-methyltransferase